MRTIRERASTLPSHPGPLTEVVQHSQTKTGGMSNRCARDAAERWSERRPARMPSPHKAARRECRSKRAIVTTGVRLCQLNPAIDVRRVAEIIRVLVALQPGIVRQVVVDHHEYKQHRKRLLGVIPMVTIPAA